MDLERKMGFRVDVPVSRFKDKAIVFEGVDTLDLAATLDCGQAFRWRQLDDGSFAAVVAGDAVKVRLDADRLEIRGAPKEKAKFWAEYFALDIDYAAIHETLSSDATMRTCMAFSPGIRVLRQEFFETLISFIISQNNNITRIKGIVERLCSCFGKPVVNNHEDVTAHAFPTPSALASLSADDLAQLRAGYRVPGILDAARRVASGELDEAELRAMSTAEARTRLLEVYGVGPKIADCVLLFGLGRFESFPVDVWIRRAMETLFSSGLPDCTMNISGIAQQYIFHYARNCDNIGQNKHNND